MVSMIPYQFSISKANVQKFLVLGSGVFDIKNLYKTNHFKTENKKILRVFFQIIRRIKRRLEN